MSFIHSDYFYSASSGLY